ncbi:nitroreductase [Pseudacidovorax sp. RU35E]|uniref:nitroreductase n=1 Tax=Pseudacidovorax sp. RU35E TaxID=1907403 RepID=UPI000955875B|nr:Nitroreductase [Pseudacidovorax sp. RU35E]
MPPAIDSQTSPVPDTDPSRTLQALLDQRYSCRGFLPQEVPRATIERILQLAQRTASWCNAQPWQVVVTRGAATERLRNALLAAQTQPPQPDFPWPREYHGVYQARRRECGLALYDAVGVAKGDREASARQALENFRFFGAPHVAIVTSDEALGVYGAVDCGAFVSNFMLAATSLGVATVPQAALASRADVLRAQLGLAADRRVVCGISFGFADDTHPANGFRTTRAGLDDVLTWVES